MRTSSSSLPSLLLLVLGCLLVSVVCRNISAQVGVVEFTGGQVVVQDRLVTLLRITTPAAGGNIQAGSSLLVQRCTITDFDISNGLVLDSINITIDSCTIQSRLRFTSTVLTGTRPTIQLTRNQLHETQSSGSWTPLYNDQILFLSQLRPFSATATAILSGNNVSSTMAVPFERHSYICITIGSRSDTASGNGGVVFESLSLCDNTVRSIESGLLIGISLLGYIGSGSLINISGNDCRSSSQSIVSKTAEFMNIWTLLNGGAGRLRAVHIDDNTVKLPKRFAGMTSTIISCQWTSVGGVEVASFSRNVLTKEDDGAALNFHDSTCKGGDMRGIDFSIQSSVIDLLLISSNTIHIDGRMKDILMIRTALGSNAPPRSGSGRPALLSIIFHNNSLRSDIYCSVRSINIPYGAGFTGVELIEFSHNIIHTAMPFGDPPIPWKFVNEMQGISMQGFGALRDIRTFRAANNTITIRGTILVHNILLYSPDLADTGLIDVSGNVMAAQSIHVTTFSFTSFYHSCVRFMEYIVNVSTVRVANNTCHLECNISFACVGLYFGSTMGLHNINTAIMENNDVTIIKEGTHQEEGSVALLSFGVASYSSNIGDLIFRTNRGSLVALDTCSAAGCRGLSVDSSAIVDYRSIVISGNNLTVRGMGMVSGAAVVSLGSVALDNARMFNALMSGVYRLDRSRMLVSGDIVIADNYFDVNSAELAGGFTMLVSGVLNVSGALRLQNNTVVTDNSFAGNAERTTPLLQQTMPTMGAGISCPAGTIRATSAPPGFPVEKLPLILRTDCSLESIVHFERGILVSDLHAHAELLFGINSSVTTGHATGLVITNSTLQPFVSTHPQNQVARSQASKPGIGIMRFTCSFPTGVVIRNVSLVVQSVCVRSWEQRALDLVGLRGGSSSNSIVIDNVTFTMHCLGIATAGNSGGGNVNNNNKPDHLSMLLFGDSQLVSMSRTKLVVMRADGAQQPQPSGRRFDLVHINKRLAATTVTGANPITLTVGPAAFNLSDSSIDGLDNFAAVADSVLVVSSNNNGGLSSSSMLGLTLSCLRWNGDFVKSKRDQPFRLESKGVFFPREVQPCAGVQKSYTATPSFSDSRSVNDSTATAIVTRSGTVSPDPVARSLGLSKKTTQNLLNAATYSSLFVSLVSANPGLFLSASRGNALIRLALCDLNTAPDYNRQSLAYQRNFTRQRMSLEVPFPKTLLPTLSMGPAAGGSLRGAVFSFSLVFVLVLLVSLYVGSLYKNKWREHRMTLLKEGNAPQRRQQWESDQISDAGVVRWAPLDLVIKALAAMVPFWSEGAGALLIALPGGGGDGAVAVLPILVAVCLFGWSCAVYLYWAVSPRTIDKNTGDNNKIKKSKQPQQDEHRQLYTETSELFLPMRACSQLCRKCLAVLRSAAGRFFFVGSQCYDLGPLLDLKANVVHPGPGPLTQFSYIFNHYCGPERQRAAEQQQKRQSQRQQQQQQQTRRSCSSSRQRNDNNSNNSRRRYNHDDDEEDRSLSLLGLDRARGSTSPEHSPNSSFAASSLASSPMFASRWRFNNALRLRLSPCWILVAVSITAAVMMIVGAGEADPATCRAGFFVAFVLVAVVLLCLCCLRPFLCPWKNWLSISFEASSFLSGILLFAALLSDAPRQSDVVAAQVIGTMPGTVLGIVAAVIAGARSALFKLGKVRVVTKAHLRRHITTEFDLVQELIFLRTPRGRTSARTADDDEDSGEAKRRKKNEGGSGGGGQQQSFWASLMQ